MKGLPLESETWDKSGELTQVVVVQSLSRVLLFVTPWTAACQASLSFIISEFAQTHIYWLVMPSNCLIFGCPLLPVPSLCPSIRVFSNELTLCIRWPKYWSFSFSISPSSEYSALIFFSSFFLWIPHVGNIIPFWKWILGILFDWAKDKDKINWTSPFGLPW